MKKLIDKTKRNYTKEHAISMLIFSKSAKFAIFESESTNETAKQKVFNLFYFSNDDFKKN